MADFAAALFACLFFAGFTAVLVVVFGWLAVPVMTGAVVVIAVFEAYT